MFNTKKIHLEISSKCVIKCPRCPRTEIKPDTLNKEFSLEDFKKAFDSNILKEIEEFIFCGDIGDPIYARDFLPIVEYIKNNSNIRLKIVTNGAYKKQDWWIQLGSLLTEQDLITFSVDGWNQESNNQYRTNTDFDSIIEGIKTLKKHSDVYVRWKAIYFAFNEDHMDQIKQVAKEAGCDGFQTVMSTKFDNQYLIDGQDYLKPKKHYSSLGRFVTETYNFTHSPIEYKDYTLNQHPWARCLNCEIELFVNVEGLILPCPWFNSGYLENSFVKKYKNELNIKHHGLKKVLDNSIWDELKETFNNDPLDICILKCKNRQ